MDSVLIVDDDADIRYLLRLVFEMDEFLVAEASNGAEAVVVALRETPDFVVLDFWMPGMMGDKTAAALRAVVPQARIVALSSDLDEQPDWADAFLNKQHISEIAPLLTSLGSFS